MIKTSANQNLLTVRIERAMMRSPTTPPSSAPKAASFRKRPEKSRKGNGLGLPVMTNSWACVTAILEP
jgi:hypothetical protein